MPIPLNNSLIKVKGNVRPIEALLFKNDKTWVAWWYCGLQKNKRANTQPYVLIAFRELVNGELSDKVSYQSFLLDLLGQIRIGSVWKNGLCRQQVKFASNDFYVDFTYGKWKVNSFYVANKNSSETPYNFSGYPLDYPNDKNWLLELELENGGKLVTPCLEFFSRCYGRSAELKRVLATYPWYGQDQSHLSRLYAPLGENEVDDGSVWKVKLRTRLNQEDVVLLAHAKYDKNYTEKIVRKIYSQIETQYDPKNPYTPIPMKIGPWFQGRAQIRVNGLWFNDGKSFLALNISGCSEPNGIKIERDRTNTNKTDLPANLENAGKAWDGMPIRNYKAPPITEITGDFEPDQNALTVDVQDPDFILLGELREITDVRRDKAISSSGNSVVGDDANSFATGDSYGSDKGVGYASINANTVMDSEGVLRDMWNAMHYFKEKYPKSITSVEWFTFEHGYQSSVELGPKLIGLKPYDKDLINDLPGDIRNWPFYQINEQVLRGILVARMIVNNQKVYFIEIQRRPRNTESNKGVTEEAYTGFVFLANNQQQVKEVVEYFMVRIRHVKGVTKKILSEVPVSKVDVFQHKKAAFETIPCEAALLNALHKMTITLENRNSK